MGNNNYLKVEPIVITGIGPVCPQAITLADLARANLEGNLHEKAVSVADWFDPVRYLGPRGFKYLTPATRYALATTSVALEDASLKENPYGPNEIGVSFGTNFAVSEIIKNMDGVVLKEGAEGLSPMDAPNFTINIPASYISIKYGFKAYNLTLTTAMVAGLEAIIAGQHSIINGRAKMALAGAVEDVPPQEVNQLLGNPAGFGGACGFVLESLSEASFRNARIYAKLGKGAKRFINPDGLGLSPQSNGKCKAVLGQMIDEVVPVGLNQIQYLSLNCSFTFNQTVAQITKDIFADHKIEIHTPKYIGEDGSLTTVSPLLQLAMAAFEGKNSLISAVSPQGHIVMLMLHEAYS